jgi:hypothetical protein
MIGNRQGKTGEYGDENTDRGRDAYRYAPPAQSRTCGFPAYGFHLGYLTAKR